MENEAISSIKIAINLIVISLTIFTVYTLINVIRPTINERIISVVNTADSFNIEQYEEYNQTLVTGTKALNLIKKSEDLDLGIIYQTYEIHSKDIYAINIGKIFDGAEISGFYSTKTGNQCTTARIHNLAAWKKQRLKGVAYYTDYYIKNKKTVVCNNYIDSIYSNSKVRNFAADAIFYSELIKGKSDEVIGLIFTQQ